MREKIFQSERESYFEIVVTIELKCLQNNNRWSFIGVNSVPEASV